MQSLKMSEYSKHVSIIKAKIKDVHLLSSLARLTFIESHGHSAGKEDVDHYIFEKYNEDIFEKELSDPVNNYYLIYYKNQLAGFSNIIFNDPYNNSDIEHVAKLDRLYLLKEFYHLKLGLALFEFNISLAKKNDQFAAWLYVWKENIRAVQFYLKAGFKVIGSHYFKISETHSNPNHIMLLKF